MNNFCKIKMPSTHKLSILYIILISGFKLGMSAPTDEIKECILPLKPDWTFFSPLIFTPNGTLITTENTNELKLGAGTEVLLSCTPNYFRDIHALKTINAICKEEKTLLVNGEEKDFVSELSCEARAIEEIIIQINGCPKTLRSIEYGYTNPVQQKSYVLGEACINTRGGRTLFVHTRIKSPTNDVTELALKIKNGTYLHQNHPTNFYHIELIKALRPDDYQEFLMVTLGVKNALNINATKFISQDFLTHKQYQPILKLAWNYAIVNDIDKLLNLNHLQKDISKIQLTNVDIYTGTHGVLSMKNSQGEQIEVHLKDHKFPVPKYLWYVVKSENKAVAFAVFNRASISDKDLQKDSFCSSKCEEITWLQHLLENKNYKKIEYGMVLCCEFHEFKRTVTEMPNLHNINELLK